MRLCAGAALSTVMVALLRLLMVTSSVAVGTTAQDHFAASCQLPLPPFQLHVAACAVARLKVIATVSRKWREQQVGTKRLSHRVRWA